MNIYEKLQQARIDLMSKGIKKTGRNKFSNYDYYELEDFIVPAMNIFKTLGLCSFISYGQDRSASLTLVDTAKPEDKIVINSSPATCDLKGMHDIQNLGAVETYHRRYLYITLLEITESDTIDGSELIPKTETKITEENPPTKPKITWMQGDLYKRLIESLDPEEIKETMKHWNTATHKMSNAYKETLLDKLKGMGAV